MGRHSAPSDDDDDQSAVLLLDAPSVGRHARHAEIEAPVEAPLEAPAEAPTELIPPITEPITGPITEPAPARSPGASDLAMIREHGDVRARCIAAVLAPFVVYFVVVLVLGDLSTRTILIWLWPELILAGVLLGFTLDLAHRRYES